MDSTLVRDLLTDLRAAAVGVLTDPPARQYAGHGNFAHDCELVAAHVTSIRAEQPDGARGAPGCALVPVVTLQLTVMRCYPAVDGDGIPDADELTAATLVLADDAVALSGGLLDLWAAGTLFPTVDFHCDRVEVGVLEPVGPGGGVAGWRISFDVRT